MTWFNSTTTTQISDPSGTIAYAIIIFIFGILLVQLLYEL